MNIDIIVIWTVVVFAFGAVAHETDIARTCKNKGNTGDAGWTIHLNCSIAPTNQ